MQKYMSYGVFSVECGECAVGIDEVSVVKVCTIPGEERSTVGVTGCGGGVTGRGGDNMAVLVMGVVGKATPVLPKPLSPRVVLAMTSVCMTEGV